MPLTETVKCGKMLVVDNGWVHCPVCRANKRLLRITPDCSATSLVLFCRKCKSEIKVDIDKGQCSRSQS